MIESLQGPVSEGDPEKRPRREERLVVTVVSPCVEHLNAYLRSDVSTDCPGSREPNQMDEDDGFDAWFFCHGFCTAICAVSYRLLGQMRS